MSSELDVLARRAKSAFDRNKASRDNWVVTTLELADCLREARARLRRNQASDFGLMNPAYRNYPKTIVSHCLACQSTPTTPARSWRNFAIAGRGE